MILPRSCPLRLPSSSGEPDRYAEAAKYYKMLEADPELAMFLRNAEVLKDILKDRTTIVIPADAEPFTLLKGVPELKGAEQTKP